MSPLDARCRSAPRVGLPRIYAALAGLVLLTGALLLTACDRSEGPQATPPGPIAKGVTLRYWAQRWTERLRAEQATTLALYRRLEEVTGIHVEFIFPTAGSSQGQLEQLLASGETPDIMEWSWFRSYPGGPAKAIDDGLVASLGPLIPEYAPNLYRIIKQQPDIARAMSTPDGRYYAFPDLQIDPSTRSRRGPLFRKDWIEKVRMQVPETLDQWHEVLRAFKQTSFETMGSGAEYPFFFLTYKPWMADEIAVPFFFESNAFAGAYGLSNGYVRRGGTIEYDPARPEYRQVLELLSGWFAEGLIHPSILDPTSGRWWIEVIAKCGAWIGGTDAAAFLKPLKYVPAPLPRGPSGSAFLGPAIPPAYAGLRSAAVSATSAQRNQAIKWLDVAYSEWGSRLFNFGIEGTSYELRRGSPVLLEPMVAELERGGFAETAEATGFYQYARGILGGPFDLSPALFSQHIEALMPGGSATVMGWREGSYEDPLSLIGVDPASEQRLPGVFGAIREHTYRGVLEFISGQRPISELESFARELDELGLPDALEILRREDRGLQSRQPAMR